MDVENEWIPRWVRKRGWRNWKIGINTNIIDTVYRIDN